jgi:hypothetical protein
MEEARRLDLRPLIAIAAIVAVALTMWATGAFAAGGSSSSPPNGSPATSIQDGNDGQERSKEDCPRDRGGSGGSGDTDGSESSEL